MRKLYLNTIFKYALSFTKSNWDIDDYPIRYRKQKIPKNHVESSRYKMYKWSAQIINWWALCGMGNTKNETYNELRQSFQKYKSLDKNLYRPGTRAPLEIAPCGEIETLYDIEIDFFSRILDMDAASCLININKKVLDN